MNIIGGIAVLGGYAYTLAINPETRNALWGGIPESWKPLYTFSMFTSAIGYLYAIYYLVFKDGLDAQFFWGKYQASLLTILISIFLRLPIVSIPPACIKPVINVENGCTGCTPG